MARRIYSSEGIKSDWQVEDPRLSLTVIFPKWKKWTHAFQATRTTTARETMIKSNETPREQVLKLIAARIYRLQKHTRTQNENETEIRLSECRMLWDRIESETFQPYDPDAQAHRSRTDEDTPPPDPEEQEARHLHEG